MTLDIPPGWQTLFEEATSAEEWDKILRVSSRCSNRFILLPKKPVLVVILNH